MHPPHRYTRPLLYLPPAMNAIRKVGILGLGKMGAPMARHLIAKGYNVAGFDPVDAARRDAIGMGVNVLDSPREVARASELVIVVVGFDHEVEAVIFGANGVVEAGVVEAAQPGLVVAIGSTVAPRYSQRLAERLLERKIVLLDVPLARGEKAAIDGKLLIYGGGDEAAFDACRPAFSAFASDIFHLGPAGAGQVGKMVNNLLLWACASASDEGLRLGEALGVDSDQLRAALRAGSGQNWAMDNRADLSGMPWAEKDMSIVLHEADLARLALPLSGTIKETIKALKIRLGYGLPHGFE
ncbi:MAG TPA: NAD(P)-dependent oxidoreductase [Burkholderiales bacterium]|nr:NAD(P)-dependent oxidoreductase [Burkholderiales bacterium]